MGKKGLERERKWTKRYPHLSSMIGAKNERGPISQYLHTRMVSIHLVSSLKLDADIFTFLPRIGCEKGE